MKDQYPNTYNERLVSRLRLQPQDEGGPSRMDILREREEAANEIERQAEVIRDLQKDAERFRWLLENCTDFMRPVDGVLTNGRFKYKRGSCFSPREAIDKAMAANG